MKDEKGLYYYPFPQNNKVRMYVREQQGTVFFRLWNEEDPELWEEHGWIPYQAIKEATSMYEKKEGFDPRQAYDLEVAKAVLREGK